MDIVERLRKRAATWLSVGWGNNDIFDEAANTIEQLRRDEEKYQAVISKLIAKKVADKYWSKFLTGDDFNPWDALKEGE